MKNISLTRGMFAIVDDDDFERLSKHKWYAERAGNSFRASRMTRNISGRRIRILMHREILGLPVDQRCDHVDLNELNNQKSNLRIANNSQNGANRRTWSKSGFRGVSWNISCEHWIAYIRKDYKRINLGCFNSKEEAAKAYDAAAIKLHGEFARGNFLERRA